MKTSKSQWIYRNISKISDRDNAKTLKGDKIEFFGNIPPKCFLRFAVTLPALPKKRHVDTHSCIAPLSCGDQFITGRKVVLIGFFGDLHRQLLFTSPLKPKNCNGWFVYAPGITTNEMSSGDEIATPLASFQLGLIITGFPRGLRRVENPPQHCPPRCTPAPRAPLVMRKPPWSAASRVRDVNPPFPYRERCEPANFQK